MKWFRSQTEDHYVQQLQAAEERTRELTSRNLETSKLNLELVRANVELTREVIRLSQRANPVVSDEDIEDPPTTRDVDMQQARRGEQVQRPAYPAGKVRPAE